MRPRWLGALRVMLRPRAARHELIVKAFEFGYARGLLDARESLQGSPAPGRRGSHLTLVGDPRLPAQDDAPGGPVAGRGRCCSLAAWA